MQPPLNSDKSEALPKVLLVANSDWGLFNFRLSLARALRKDGAEVVLVCPEGKYVNRLREAGFRTLTWNLKRRSISPVSEALSLLRLIQIYRDESPRLVHHFTIKPNLYGALAARFAGVSAVINTWTGLGYVFSDSARARPLRRGLMTIMRFLHRDRRIWSVFQNEENLRVMVDRGIVSSGRVSMIAGSGVDTALFRPRPGGAPSRVPVVLMAARLLRDKGVYEFAEAASLVEKTGYKARFLLAGSIDEGNPASLSQGELDEIGRSSPIELLGHRDDMSDLLAQVDFAVLPSYHEGLPRFLLEAAATGLPLVATDIPGCRAIVRPHLNGILVPPRNSQSLADAMIVLIGNPELSRQFGLASRELAVSDYGDERINLQYLALYQRLAGFPYSRSQGGGPSAGDMGATRVDLPADGS